MQSFSKKDMILDWKVLDEASSKKSIDNENPPAGGAADKINEGSSPKEKKGFLKINSKVKKKYTM